MNLYVKSISKSIKGEKVLDDISYTFESGKIYGIYGKNGSGKTTIMNVLFYFLTKQWEELVSINFNSISIKFIGHAKLLTVTRKEIFLFGVCIQDLKI